MAGPAAPPCPTGQAAEGAEGRCGQVAPTPSGRCGAAVLRPRLHELRKDVAQAWGSHWFSILLCRGGAFKNRVSAFLDPKHFHQVQDSEVRELRLPSVSCPQHLVLSLEEQVS